MAGEGSLTAKTFAWGTKGVAKDLLPVYETAFRNVAIGRS